MKLKRIFSIVLCLSLLAALLSVPALAADSSTLTLREDWRLTSDLDLNVPEGTTLTIDGGGQYYIYELGGKLLNSGYGTVLFTEGTILYPEGAVGTCTTQTSIELMAQRQPSASAPAEPSGGSSAVSSGAKALIFSGADLGNVAIKVGQTVDLSQYVPTKAGYTFGGWYLDKDFTKPATTVVMSENLTIYAKWIKNDGEPDVPEEPTVGDFTDVKESAWYADSVRYVTDKGLFQGTSETSFSPGNTMTRAMLMTVLARLDSKDTTPAQGQTWYAPGMDWAKNAGISDGTNPGGAITREQLATMLYRYAGEPETSGSLTSFTDAGKVSRYAEKAMKWAVENGIVGGKGNGIIDPKGSATRAEVSAMLMRYCEKIGK